VLDELPVVGRGLADVTRQRAACITGVTVAIV
jgi:hypothetical protein